MSTKTRLTVEWKSPTVFVSKYCDVVVNLVDDANRLLSSKSQIPIEVFAEFENQARCPNGFLELCHDTCHIGPDGKGKIRFRISEVTMNHENKKFRLVFRAKLETSSSSLQASSDFMQCIRHRLSIIEENSTTYTWYKDEGGKDKCIELRVHLKDADDKIVRNRNVPLKATLVYRSGQSVPLQAILSVSPDSRLTLDESLDGAILRLRINEVSTRHQGQMFQVLVSPDLSVSPSFGDISSAVSSPVDVKSKRNNKDKVKDDGLNKRARLGREWLLFSLLLRFFSSISYLSIVWSFVSEITPSTLQSMSGLEGVNTAMSVGSMFGQSHPLNRIFGGALAPAAALTSTVSGQNGGPGILTNGVNLGTNNLTGIRTSPRMNSSSSAMNGINGNHENNNINGNLVTNGISAMDLGGSESPLGSKLDSFSGAENNNSNINNTTNGLAFGPPSNFTSALDNIVLWTNTIMHGVDAIQWTQVGGQDVNSIFD